MRNVIEFQRTRHHYSAAELSYAAAVEFEEFCSVFLDGERPENDGEQARLRLVE